MASEEASLHVFHWFFVNGEGLPPENIYHDDWLCEIWDEDESGGEADEADERHSQELVAQHDDRFETWLDTIG